MDTPHRGRPEFPENDLKVPSAGQIPAPAPLVAPEDETDPLEVGGLDEDEDDEDDDEFDEDDMGLMMMDHADLITTGIRECGLPGPPDGGWGWVIVLASFIINMIMDGVTSSFTVLLPQIVVTYRDSGSPGIGRSDVAWAGSLLCGVSMCVGPVTSALTNKYGCRPVCMVGGAFAAVGFLGAAYSPNLPMLLLTYGLVAGIGFGMLYLPSIVCVSYYFEKKRACATGLAVSGSGLGAIIFAPLITSLNEVADWRQVCLGFSALLALLLLAGATMKPLKLKVDALGAGGVRAVPKHTPLLQRMAVDKKHYLEKASVMGSQDYFMVQLPDGTMERRLKISSNVDPGVHSSLYLDQLVVGGGGIDGGTPIPPSVTNAVDILPTISETNKPATQESSSSGEDVALKCGPGGRMNGVIPFQQSQDEGKSPTGKGKASAPTDIPQADGTQRKRRVSEGEQHHISPSANQSTSFGIARFLNLEFLSKDRSRERDGAPTPPVVQAATPQHPPSGADIGRNPSFTRSIGRPTGFSTSRGSAAQFSRTDSTDTGLGDGSGILGSIPSPRERKFSFAIRAVPTSSSLGKTSQASFGKGRRDSIDSTTGTGRYRASNANVKGSRREMADDDYRSLLSNSEVSQILRRSSTRKRSMHREQSHGAMAHSVGGAGDGDKMILRTMSRKDIFYAGSIHNLEEYQSQSLTGYRQSVLNLQRAKMSVPGAMDEELGGPGAGEEVLRPPFCPLMTRATGSFLSALGQMMDFSLVRNPAFLVIAVSGVICMLGFYVPMVYTIDFAAKKNIDEKSAAWFISLIGITSTVGRIGFGLLSDIRGVDSFLIYNMCIVLMGLATCALPLCFNYYLIAAMYTLFGIALSGFISLSSIILVKLLGLDNLTNAFGLLLFFRGISTVLGTPLSGAIFDATKSYDIPFYLAGAFLLISAAISFLSPAVARWATEMRSKREICKPLGVTGPLEDILEVVESSSEDEAEAEAEADEEEKKRGHAMEKDGGLKIDPQNV